MRHPLILLALLALLPLAAAAPPETPPGLAGKVSDLQVTNEDGSINWATVGVSVAAATLFLGGGYLLHRRMRDDTTVTVQSDEEAVLAVLDDNDGQVKQPALKQALDWSDSKVSRVTSRLAEDGAIEKLQLGRENIVKRTQD